MYPNNLSWPEEHSEALRLICSEKDIPVTRIIAQRINALFGTNYSRQSIVGRAHRMKLTLQPKKCKQHGATMKEAKQKKRHSLPPMEYANLRTVDVPARHISLIDLEPGDCRYPYGDGGQTTFCGCEVMDGFPYCADHMSLTHREALDAKSLVRLQRLYRARAA